MKSIIVLCLLTLGLAALSQADNSPDYKKAEILKYENNNDGLGRYNFRYKQSDGTEHFQRGNIVNGHSVVKGRYTFVGTDGIIYSVKYVADENGYRAEIEEGAAPGNPLLIPSMLG